jgi:MYXO-CTERM domain-containing protein
MGAGSNLEIVVHSGALAPQTLPLTFSYLQPKETDPPKADDPSSCAAGTGASWMALLSVLVIGAIAVRRRRA